MNGSPKKISFDSAAAQKMEAHTRDVIRFNIVEQAKIFVYKVWPKINADKTVVANHDLYGRLERVYTLNSILLLGSLPDKTVINLFKQGIEYYFFDMIENVDLWELIRAKLVVNTSIEERDVFKGELRKALLLNNGLITKDKIERNSISYQPSIAQWLVDYTSFAGVGIIDRVKMNEYFTVNKNVQKLSDQEKNIVRTLILIYERLKRSSKDPEGLEERVNIYENGKFVVFREGSFEDIDPKIKKFAKLFEEKGDRVGVNESSAPGLKISTETPTPQLSNAENEILAAYQGDLKQQQAIAREQERISKKISGNADQLSTIFYQAVQSKNIVATVAALRVMAELDSLGTFLKTDEKLNKFLSLTWEKQYGKALVDEFVRQPNQLKFIKLFLQYVLQQRLGLTTSDAARIGLQIANIFVKTGKKEYNKLAYFDVSSKSFRWF